MPTTSTLPAFTPFTLATLPLSVTVAVAGAEEETRSVASVAFAGKTLKVRSTVAPTATLAVVGETVSPVTGTIGESPSSAINGLPELVTLMVRVITSLAVTVLPRLLTHPLNTSTVPFGYLIL